MLFTVCRLGLGDQDSQTCARARVQGASRSPEVVPILRAATAVTSFCQKRGDARCSAACEGSLHATRQGHRSATSSRPHKRDPSIPGVGAKSLEPPVLIDKTLETKVSRLFAGLANYLRTNLLGGLASTGQPRGLPGASTHDLLVSPAPTASPFC